MKQLVLASGNAGKLREFAHLLAPFDFEVLPQGHFGVPEAAEPHVTYDENALAYRARRYFDTHPGEVSIGFLYDRMRLVVGKDSVVYPSYNNRMWRFERSLLPMGKAAFPASYLDGATGIATL